MEAFVKSFVIYVPIVELKNELGGKRKSPLKL